MIDPGPDDPEPGGFVRAPVAEPSRPARRPAARENGGVPVDLPAAAAFVATHGRLLERRRLGLLLDPAAPGAAAGVLAALDAHRNPDGGYGWGLEPDLRSPESQPAAAMHALEVLHEAVDTPGAPERAEALCGWLERHTHPDGGLPFALPLGSEVGCAPLWAAADPEASSRMMTAQVAAGAHRLAPLLPGVAGHPWLARATVFCAEAIGALGPAPHAYELVFAARFLDAAGDAVPGADGLWERIGAHVPPHGTLPVAGGIEGEVLRPLDLAPDPGCGARRLLADGAVAADLERLAGAQAPDGGWPVDFAPASAAAALEWRGYATVKAVVVLRRQRGAVAIGAP